MLRTNLVVVALIVSTFPACNKAFAIDFDDIQFWAGSGANQAAVVIDWDRQTGVGESTVWGYRWDGQATGYDMLAAVISADQQLYAKLGGTAVVFGIGYDEPDSPPFALDDGTEFDRNGIAESGITDGASATDPADRYAEGWYTGYWFYANADSSPYAGDTWERSTVGLGVRQLSDGVWDAWTFTNVFNTVELPDTPIPAIPPGGSSLVGDYNSDQVVDLADYTTWRNSLGQQVSPVGDLADGNGNGLVDAADYDVWKQHFGASLASPNVVAVPEPHNYILAMTFVLLGLRVFTSGS